MSDPLAQFEETFLPHQSLAPSGNTTADGFVVLDAVRAKTANFTAADIPAISSPWSSFPAWTQEAIKFVYNDLKGHYLEATAAKTAIERLEAHHAASTWPQFVLAAVPGFTSFSVDTTVVSEEEKSVCVQTMHQAVESARRVLLDQTLSVKKVAWQRHSDGANSGAALRALRCRFFENLQAMGVSGDNQNQHLGLLSRTLSQLGHMIQELDTRTRWASVSAARQKASKDSARSAADVVMSDTTVTSKSVEKLVEEKLAQKLRALALPGKGHRPLVPGSAKGRVTKGAPAQKGKKTAPKSAPKPAPRKFQPNNSNNKRLAPSPSPFKSLQKAKGQKKQKK